MALCSCFSCSSTSGEQPAQWFLCATVDGPSDPGSNPSDTGTGSSADSNSNLAAIVAVTSAIGTTGNFTNYDINGLL